MKRMGIVIAACLLVSTTAAFADTAVYTINANVRASLTFPASEGIEQVEYLAPEDALLPVPLDAADGGVSFTLTPTMMPEGKAILVINRPPGLDLSDREPPEITGVAVDGHAAAPASTMLLPFEPSELSISLADVSGIDYSALDISANGERVARGALSLDRAARGKEWTITYTRPEDMPLRSLRIAAEDASLLRNQVTFSLTVEQGLAVLEDEKYSGSKAIHFATETAYVAITLNLDAGEYELEIIGHAPNSGSNSWWVEVDGTQQADPVHIPEVEPGICSSVVEIDPEALPHFIVPEDGQHVVALILREGPGPVLDKVRILRDGEEVAAYEGEDILPRAPRP
jgi:hypothetical protein